MKVIELADLCIEALEREGESAGVALKLPALPGNKVPATRRLAPRGPVGAWMAGTKEPGVHAYRFGALEVLDWIQARILKAGKP